MWPMLRKQRAVQAEIVRSGLIVRARMEQETRIVDVRAHRSNSVAREKLAPLGEYCQNGS